jgi:hypothetical protein
MHVRNGLFEKGFHYPLNTSTLSKRNYVRQDLYSARHKNKLVAVVSIV